MHFLPAPYVTISDGDGDPGGDPAPGRGKPADPPFPSGTRVEDMTAEQQAAYWREQSRKHEGRNRDLLAITGGRYGDDLRADFTELGKLRTQNQTDAERATTEAVEAARAEERGTWATKLVQAEFRAALAHVDEERRGQIIEGLALANFLDKNGDVDTAKVTAHAAVIAPADKGQGGNGRQDFGAGRRPEGQAASGVQAGAAMFAASRKKSTTTN